MVFSIPLIIKKQFFVNLEQMNKIQMLLFLKTRYNLIYSNIFFCFVFVFSFQNMGHYLATPNKEKHSEEGGFDKMKYAASSMQGRVLFP